jgi:hypothetical protein
VSDKPMTLWERFDNWWRWTLAELAMRHCGPAMLFWVDVERWEDYIAIGQSLTDPLEEVQP